jgi:hypothetical protein
MQKYRVVVCENCGCEYNPVGRDICPATNCEQKTPEDPSVVEARLAAAEAELATKKAVEKKSEKKATRKPASTKE